METDREIKGQESRQKETNMLDMDTVSQNTIRREYDFAPDVKLKECRFCRVMIPKKAKICPNCRMSLKRHWFRNLAAVVFAVAVIGAGGYYLSAHWGIMKDAVASVWMAQDRSALPVMSMTTDHTEMDKLVGSETTEAANIPETAEKTAQQTESKAGAGAETAEAAVKDGSGENKSNTLSAVEKETEDRNDIVEADAQDTESRNDTASAETGEAEDKTVTAADGEEEIENGNEAAPAEAKEIGRKSEAAVMENEKAAAPAEAKITENEKETEMVDASERENKSSTAAVKAQGVTENQTSTERDTEETYVDSGAMGSQEIDFREDCIEVSYKSLLRDPETYLDEALMVEVQVVCQVNGGLFDDNTYYLCKTDDANNITRYYIVRDDRETDDTLILEGDLLTVFGKMFGTCRIPADLIGTRPTVPAVSMLYYDLTGE